MLNPHRKGLNNKQLLFCLNYLKGLNAYQALLHSGYAESTAKQMSTRALCNRKILRFLKWEQKRQVEIQASSKLSVIQECLERSEDETLPPEIRKDYLKEYRAWQKQEDEIRLKLKEIEAKIKANEYVEKSDLIVSFELATKENVNEEEV